MSDIIQGAPQFQEPLEDAVTRLAALTALKYDRARLEEAKRLGVRVSVLDGEVGRRRKQDLRDAAQAHAGDGLGLADVHKPWAEPVDGRTLLDRIHTTLRRFVVAPNSALIATTLWIVFTYLIENKSVIVSPRLMITSPEKRCGKTRLLEIIAALAFRPVPASNISPSIIYRACDICPLTLLIDEADTFVKGREELRGLLNSGHTRSGAYVMRSVSPDERNWIPKRFSTWGAFAVAAIGRLPDTWLDRSIEVRLQRKLRSEKVHRFLQRDSLGRRRLKVLAQKIARWVADNQDAVVGAAVEPLKEINDRADDNWEVLLAIATVAGGEWLTWARAAAVELSREMDVESFRTMLLTDLRAIFSAPENVRATSFSSADLCRRLASIEGRPWAGSRRGAPIDQNQLASLLRPFKIFSTTVWLKPPAKGYKRRDFLGTFKRYLPPIAFIPAALPVSALDPHAPKGKKPNGWKKPNGKVTHISDVSRQVRKYSKDYRR